MNIHTLARWQRKAERDWNTKIGIAFTIKEGNIWPSWDWVQRPKNGDAHYCLGLDTIGPLIYLGEDKFFCPKYGHKLIIKELKYKWKDIFAELKES